MTNTEQDVALPRSGDHQYKILLHIPDVELPLFSAAAIVGVPTRTLERMEKRGKIACRRLPMVNGRAGERRYSLHDALKLRWSEPEEIANQLLEAIDITPEERASMLTAAETAQVLGIARNTLHRWHAEGRLVPLEKKVGRHRMYKRVDVEAILNEGV